MKPSPTQDFIQIPLGGRKYRDRVALIDSDDAHVLSGHKWYVAMSNGYPYVQANTKDETGQRRTVLLHRLIMDAPKGAMVDHISGNTLDNRKSNLRLASRSENGRNSRKRTRLSSRFKGVHWCNRESRWMAYIFVEGKSLYLGRFTDELAAASAYNEAAAQHFGEFAWLNPIDREVAR